RNANGVSLGLARMISAGSNSRAVVARSRSISSTGSRSPGGGALSPDPSPAPPGGSLFTTKPPHAEAEHDQRCQSTEAGGREGRGTEERHRDGILDRRRSRKGGHGKSRRAQHDCGWHQSSRNSSGAKQL